MNPYKGLIAFGLTGFFLWMLTLGVMTSHNRRGITIGWQECAWRPEADAYEVRFSVRSEHDTLVVANLIVQAHFEPPHGSDWPNRRIRSRLRTQNQHKDVPLRPRAIEEDEALFSLGGLPNFRCKANIIIAGQEHYPAEREY